MLTVQEALEKRRSVRAFTDAPVSLDVVRAILDEARRVPSGGNMQNWRVIAVAGAERQGVIDLAHGVFANSVLGEPTDKPVYPPGLWEPYRTRRFEIGEALYGLLGIPREDKAARLTWFARNYEFFGAPVGLFFIIDERLGHSQWAYIGMLYMAVLLAAEARGLVTCPQECWSVLRPSLKAHFELGEHEMVWCGMALGHEDASHVTAALRSPREPVGAFAQFRGF